jgi:hypothetical protein
MEKVIPGLAWETYYRRELVSAVRIGTWPLSVLAPGGMFLATQIIAIGIGLSKFIREPVEIFLLAMSIFALVVTVSLLIITGREREKYRKL